MINIIGKKILIFCICILCCSCCFIACNNSEYDERKAEQLVEQFYTYYIANYGNIDESVDDIASKYLTDDFGKNYVTHMRNGFPVDLLSGGIPYHKGGSFDDSFNKAEYVGNNKVNVTFDRSDGKGQFHWLLTVLKVDSEYRISNFELNN